MVSMTHLWLYRDDGGPVGDKFTIGFDKKEKNAQRVSTEFLLKQAYMILLTLIVKIKKRAN